MKCWDEKFYWTYQHGVHWSDDYIGPDSMARWIIEKSDGFTYVGLLRILENVRAYTYLILSSQASVRSSIVENTASALTAQSAFLNNFENVMKRRVNIQEDIKRRQDTLSYALIKVDYSVGENIYVLPSDMNLKIRSGTVRYNNKILVSDEKFNLEKNEKVNALAMKSHKVAQTATNSNDVLDPQAPLARPHWRSPARRYTEHKYQLSLIKKNQKPKTITHNDEKIALVLFLASGFAIWNIFQ